MHIFRVEEEVGLGAVRGEEREWCGIILQVGWRKKQI